MSPTTMLSFLILQVGVPALAAAVVLFPSLDPMVRLGALFFVVPVLLAGVAFVTGLAGDLRDRNERAAARARLAPIG